MNDFIALLPRALKSQLVTRVQFHKEGLIAKVNPICNDLDDQSLLALACAPKARKLFRKFNKAGVLYIKTYR